MHSMRIAQSLAVAFALALASSGCNKTGCPTRSSSDARAKWEAELDKKTELVLDATRDITIKRDVHVLVVSADAPKLAAAFHDVMRDPKRHFGLIKVDRKQANLDKPFQLGERFQGRYEIDEALKKDLAPWAKKMFGELVDDPGVKAVLCDIENQSTSDYGVIAKLDLAPKDGQDFVLSYHYLSGSPIAGSSTFIVRQVAPGTSSLTQVFEYQELSPTFAVFFSSGGLKLHNQVVFSQVTQAAELIGAKIVSSDIPDAYRNP
jgi:hypothetical protein